ncbi:MAG TPA: response regulator transcription factor [Bacteroidota bacterium]|nr:response regulator transcription factor [Bacteroidota bacterium]
MNKIKLLLIEDNRLLRSGILAMLKGHADIKAAAGHENGDNGASNLRDFAPDIVLIDVGPRTIANFHRISVIKEESPAAKIIVMDIAPSEGDILHFVQAGVTGFILKKATLHDFLATIRSVAGGESVLPPLLNASLFIQIIEQNGNGGTPKTDMPVRMTVREREVIGLIGEGLSNKAIGARLHIATYTVKSHVHNIMEKLTLHTRLEVATFGYTDGTGAKEIVKSVHLLDN